TLRALIGGRVSRLDAQPRAAMQAAAILGDPVPLQVLAAMLRRSVPQIDGLVASLAAKDFLRPSGPSWAVFASPMLGEIVLAAILPEVRRELHASAAAAYIATLGDSEEHADRVAHHLHEAGERDRAATFFFRAARARLRLDQIDIGTRWLVHALDLADVDLRTPTELASWLTLLADATTRARAAPPLADVLARALRRIDAAGTLEERAIARVDAARAESAVNSFVEAYKHLEEGQALAGDRDDLRARGLIVEIETAARTGDFTRALRAGTRLEAAGPIDDAPTLALIGFGCATQGDRERALAAIDQAARLSDSLHVAADREKIRGLVHAQMRDFHGAAEASARAVDLARSLGLRFAVAIGLHNLGDSTRRIGDLPRAYASLTESKDLAELGGHERLAMLNRTHLAYLDGLSGSDAALATLRELLAYQEARRFLSDALESRFLLGSLLRRRGDSAAARKELEDVLERAIDLGNKLIAEDAREELGELRG
ncbi:MAG TPA: hypothetical protein VGM56_09730, partial [Byssovorax sp.]